jgi:hypothetical protein
MGRTLLKCLGGVLIAAPWSALLVAVVVSMIQQMAKDPGFALAVYIVMASVGSTVVGIAMEFWAKRKS